MVGANFYAFCNYVLSWGKIVLFSKLKVSTCWKGAFGEELASDALGDGFVSKSLILILK